MKAYFVVNHNQSNDDFSGLNVSRADVFVGQLEAIAEDSGHRLSAQEDK